MKSLKRNQQTGHKMKTKAQAIKIINTLFNAIPVIHQGWTTVHDRMYILELGAEKHHRKNRDNVVGFSCQNAARYFTIQHLFEGKDGSYSIDSIIDIRFEALLGQAYAQRFNKELAEWFKLVESSEWDQVDYSELMK